MEYKCNDCKKNYSSYQSLWIHNKKYHKVIVTTNNNIDNTPVNLPTNINNSSEVNHKVYNCKFCNKSYNIQQSRWKHEQNCKTKKNIVEENKKLKTENEILKKNNEIISSNKNIDKSEPINNQLINIIVDKTKIIENLKNKIPNEEQNQSVSEKKELPSLNFNNVIIIARLEDNYINATKLCEAGGKDFNRWYSLNKTTCLINALGLTNKNEIEVDNEQVIWIQPDLAIQLAHWISPVCGFTISKWIRTLFKYDIKLLEDKDIEIKLKDQKIQLLEDTYIKKQKRKNYPDNVIYIVTTNENKKNRIYIIGKAISFKDRLSTYNKTAEHEVIYYKECKNTDILNAIEHSVLTTLHKYREKANRDRFILPIGKNIDLFTTVIDQFVKLINGN
jgi:hypothetical protein